MTQRKNEIKKYAYDISLIIATKNRGALLDQTLASLYYDRSRVRIEFIIIDGNSSDNTIEVLRKHGISSIYNESVLFGQNRPTWPQLYNYGFSIAKGKWAMYASDDILFSEDCLSRALCILEEQSDNVAGGIFYYRNIIAAPGWENFGIDFTYGQKLLLNYGVIRLDKIHEAGGLDEAYRFYCADGDLCLKLYKKGYDLIPLDGCRVIHNNVLDESKKKNAALAETDIQLYQEKWKDFVSVVLPDPRRLFMSSSAEGNIHRAPCTESDFTNRIPGKTSSAPDALKNIEILNGQPVKLHLGCGQNYLQGYINIDYPSSEHNVMNTAPDVACDLMELKFPDCSIDEIRLHHVFEHFNRVTALALLIRWHRWLKKGGLIRIETPDLIGSSRTLLSDASFKTKMGVVRHLAGDQAASWAYHIDHWFPERFEVTLREIGYTNIEIRTSSWPVEPYLSNVEVSAVKGNDFSVDELIEKSDRLLWDSTVSDKEKPVYEVWKKQLREIVSGEKPHRLANVQSTATEAENSALLKMMEKFLRSEKPVPLSELHNFNQLNRDKWVKEKAAEITAGQKVLDIGAGTCPYADLFRHCDYKTHDFKKYEGSKLNGAKEYGKIDYVSDILNIPVENDSFDVILCTEVLEHVPEPIKALEEMQRILRPGGRLFLTAPLGSGLHQLPYHYYGGFTPEWYRHFGLLNNFEIVEITPNGGFFKLLAQETARFVWTLPEHGKYHGNKTDALKKIFSEYWPAYLYELEDKYMNDQFTVGYHVEMKKRSADCEANRNKRDETKNHEVNNKTAVKNKENIAGVIFSKNRAMQLDALLKSFFERCKDQERIDLKVLYKADDEHKSQYRLLEKEYANVQFIAEFDFKSQLIQSVQDSEFILFLVDDCIFINDFSIKDLCNSLKTSGNAIGLSLRLGRNTGFCYTKNVKQNIPEFIKLSDGMLIFNWTGAEFDFNYSLEVSSSIYRTREIIPVLTSAAYNNPNTLEGTFSEIRNAYAGYRPMLLCPESSLAFCAPVNKVQNVADNRAGIIYEYSAEKLKILFDEGKRIDVSHFKGFVPSACHEEVEFRFLIKANVPEVTIFTAAYNAEKYIAKTIESVLCQSKKDFEYIIVDDGSTDSTVDIIRQFRDPRIRLILNVHKNYASAVNTAIKNSRGKYVLAVDSDDYISETYLEKIYETALNYPEADYIYPQDFCIIDENGNLTGENPHFQDFTGDKNIILLRKLFLEATSRVPNPGSLKKMKLFERVGLFKEVDTIEDYIFLSENCLKISFRLAHGVSGYFYRVHSSNLSRKYQIRSKLMADAIYKMFIEYPLDVFFGKGPDGSEEGKVNYFLQCLRETFIRHSEFYNGRGGEYFAEYADRISEQLK